MPPLFLADLQPTEPRTLQSPLPFQSRSSVFSLINCAAFHPYPRQKDECETLLCGLVSIHLMQKQRIELIENYHRLYLSTNGDVWSSFTIWTGKQC